MVRAANAQLVVLALAPFVFLTTAEVLTLQGRALGGSSNIVQLLFPTLVAVSIANVALTVLIQVRRRVAAGTSQYVAINRAYVNVSIGAVLSETHSIYGLILTIFSGSIIYEIGFSLATWMSLFWVRAQFKENLARIPSE